MTNLRELAESDLEQSLENDWGLPVILIAPDGAIQTLSGQVMYETKSYNPETGEEIFVNAPNVTLRVSSLTRVPLPGEKWIVQIPITPSSTAPKVDFLMSPTKPPKGGASLGYITLFLTKAEQT